MQYDDRRNLKEGLQYLLDRDRETLHKLINTRRKALKEAGSRYE